MAFRIDTAGAGFGSALLLVSITSTQAGSSFAKFLFGLVGPEAAVALRLLTSTLMLFAVLRPWRHVPKGGEWKSVALYGLSIAVMNASFYQAISRIPLGIAVAIEFSGPLLVAAGSSRRFSDYAAVALAAAGLLTLMPWAGVNADLDMTGVFFAALAAVFKYFNNIFNTKGSERLMQTMRDQLFAHVQKLPFAWHMKNQTGDIIQRCTSDVERVKIFVAEQLTSIIRIVILMTLSLTFMFSMDGRLTLIALCSIPVIIGYSAFFHSRIGRRFQECDENEGILSTIAQENLTGVRVVRAFGREKFEKDRFEKQNNYYANLWVHLMRLMSAFWGSGDL
ncbi:MAG: hypothetical protein IKY97_02230, partial [Mailhella sp.]|nr:hypothetical protein [Mailhella sp.]